MEGKTPGVVNWGALGIDLEMVEAAQVILLTGWTWEEYNEQPLALIDAVVQVHAAQKELEAWAIRGRRK